MTLLVGLTGSIGMGKSTTAAMFAAHGVPVFDADATVHRLYGGAAVAPVEAAFPGVAVDGRIDRARLSARVLGDPAAITRLEAIVHPLVRAEEAEFIGRCLAARQPLAVLDIPLLFETGAAGRGDIVAVVSAPPDVQKARVMARPGMTGTTFAAIVARQMPDAEKRRRAHWIIDTGSGLPEARLQVASLLMALAGRPGRAFRNRPD